MSSLCVNLTQKTCQIYVVRFSEVPDSLLKKPKIIHCLLTGASLSANWLSRIFRSSHSCCRARRASESFVCATPSSFRTKLFSSLHSELLVRKHGCRYGLRLMLLSCRTRCWTNRKSALLLQEDSSLRQLALEDLPIVPFLLQG